MTQKRKHTDASPEEMVHPDRQAQVPGAHPKPAKKPRKSEPIFKKQAHASSVNAIKKRIRDVTRKLERSDSLPANLRVEDERALETYQQELADAEAEKLRNKMIKKYHMVRFFERRKAERQLKRLRKRILDAKSTDEVETLKAQMGIAEVDLNYTQYYPLSEVYVSLYPPKDGASGEDDEKLESIPKPPMWAEVESCMKEGTLSKLRNRKPNIRVKISRPMDKKPKKAIERIPKPKPTIDTAGLNRRERRRAERGFNEVKTKNKSIGFLKNQEFGASMALQGNEDAGGDDDSEGGFFEE